jgi:hypothetical protein
VSRRKSSACARPYIGETRKCRSCYGSGSVLVDAQYDFATGEPTQGALTCFACRGAGSVYAYPGRSR